MGERWEPVKVCSPEEQDERIKSLASDVPPFDQPPLKGTSATAWGS